MDMDKCAQISMAKSWILPWRGTSVSHPPTNLHAITHKTGQVRVSMNLMMSHIASLMLRFRDNHQSSICAVLEYADEYDMLLFFTIYPCTYALLSGVVTITILRMTQNHAASKNNSCSEKHYTATLETRQKSPFTFLKTNPHVNISPKPPVQAGIGHGCNPLLSKGWC